MYKFVIWHNDGHEFEASMFFLRRQDILLIGDGKRTLTKEDFDLSDHADKIDANAQFVLRSHGYFNKKEQSEYYGFAEKEDPKKTVAVKGCELVALMNQGITEIKSVAAPKIHIFSCYSGASLFYDSQQVHMLDAIRSAEFTDGTIVMFHGGPETILFGSIAPIFRKLCDIKSSNNSDLAKHASDAVFEAPSSMAIVHKTNAEEIRIAKFQKPKGFDVEKYQAEFELFNASLAECFGISQIDTHFRFQDGMDFDNKALDHFVPGSAEDIHAIISLDRAIPDKIFASLRAELERLIPMAYDEESQKTCDLILKSLVDLSSKCSIINNHFIAIKNTIIKIVKDHGEMGMSPSLEPHVLRQIKNISDTLLPKLMGRMPFGKTTIDFNIKTIYKAIVENIDLPGQIGEILLSLYFDKDGKQLVGDRLLDEQFKEYFKTAISNNNLTIAAFKDFASKCSNITLLLEVTRETIIDLANLYGIIKCSDPRPQCLDTLRSISDEVLLKLMERSGHSKASMTEFIQPIRDAIIENIDIAGEVGEILLSLYFKKSGEQVVDDSMLDGQYHEYREAARLKTEEMLEQKQQKIYENHIALLQAYSFILETIGVIEIIDDNPIQTDVLRSQAKEMETCLKEHHSKNFKLGMAGQELTDILSSTGILGESPTIHDDVAVVA
jgi:hypothetical protein